MSAGGDASAHPGPSPTAGPPRPDAAAEPAGAGLRAAAGWRGLMLVGGGAALGSVALIVLQVILFTVWPPVETAGAAFDLMQRSPAVGLVSLDVLLLVNNLLVLLVYLGVAPLLWPVSRSGTSLVVALGIVQISAYVTSNPAVEMLNLSARWAEAPTGDEQEMLLAAGEGVLSSWRGTAFLVYYWLGAAILFILAWLLLRSPSFHRGAGWWALTAAVLMLVPSTFGIVGIAFSLVSLVPWCAMCVLIGWHLVRLGRGERVPRQPVHSQRTLPPADRAG